MENSEDIVINNVIINNEQDNVIIINKTDNNNVIETKIETTDTTTTTTTTTDTNEIIFEKILSIIKDNNSNLLGQYFEELSGIKKEKERLKNEKINKDIEDSTEILNEEEIKKKIKKNNRYTYQQEQEDLNKHREDEIIENNKYFNFRELLNKLIPTIGKTLLYTAIENDCFNDIVLLLLKYGADPNISVTTTTTTTSTTTSSNGGGSSNGETSTTIQDTEDGGNENYYKKPADTESSIHYVVRNGDSTILNLLLDYNVDVNRLDGFGRTAIILSSANGKTECSRLLVLKSCNVNIVDQRQKTALHLAIDGGYDDIATTITQNGGNVSLRYHYRPKSTKPQNNPSSQDYTDYKDVKILTKLDRYGNIQDGYNQFDSGSGDNGTASNATTTSNQPEQVEQSPVLTSTVVPRKYSRKSTINSGLTLNISNSKNKKEIEKELTRSIKWNKMIKKWNSSGSSLNEKKRFPTKFKTRAIKGIPDRMRSESWPMLSRSEIEKKKNPDLFNQLVQQHSEMEICIDLDVNRAFRNHLFFRERYGVGQVSLFNVLKVYSLYDTNVGYTQGMSSIASLLVMYLSEEDAFWTLQSLMKRPEFDLRTKFLSGLPGFFKMVFVFNNLLNQYFPAVKKAFDEIGLDAVLYTTKWFLIGYLDSFPFHISLRVWDLIFSHGYNIVYSVALSLFKLKEKQLLQYKDSFEKLCNLLKSFESFDIDEDIFINLIIKHKISDKKIEFWEKKYELQQQQQQQTANTTTN